MYFGKQIKIVTTTISFTLLKLRISCQFVNVPDLLEIKNNGQGIQSNVYGKTAWFIHISILIMSRY